MSSPEITSESTWGEWAPGSEGNSGARGFSDATVPNVAAVTDVLDHLTRRSTFDAVDRFRRSIILAESNVAYGRFDEEDAAERREIEGTIGDGLDDE